MNKFNAKKTTDNIIEWMRTQGQGYNNIIGISGGKDSTTIAMLSVLAFGVEGVFGVLIPDGVQKDISDSIRVCELLGIDYSEVNIGMVTDWIRTAIRLNKGNKPDNKLNKALVNLVGKYNPFSHEVVKLNDCYETNTPARVRMTILYAIGAIIGNARIVNTCNGDENYVGYATKFGDAAGDYSPLSELTVEEVLLVAEECARRLGIYEEIKDLIFKTPDDGMSNKSDEEKLGFAYKTVGDYRRTGICNPIEVKDKIDRMYLANLHKTEPMPVFKYNPDITD